MTETIKHPPRYLWICGAVLIVTLLALVFVNYFYWTGWQIVPRSAARVDLRGSGATFDDCARIQSQLPGCEILWDIPFQGKLCSSDLEALTVTSLSREDLAVLEQFPRLATLDATHCTDYPALMEYQTRHPECAVLYTVTLGGTDYSQDSDKLVIRDPVPSELEAGLPFLPRVTEVRLEGVLPGIDVLESLREHFPGIRFLWTVTLGNREYPSSTSQLDLAGNALRFGELTQTLDLLPELRSLNVMDCGLSDAELKIIAARYPKCFVLCQMEVAGLSFPTDSTMIDISNRTVKSREEIEALLPFFPKLERVIMCRCGLDDETMDSLNKAYDNIRFVWSVKIKDVYVRTDATYFYPFKFYKTMSVDTEDLYPLRYCTDMVCIDIGHMGAVTNCEWAAFMPELKYLILGETGISDLSPLSNCKKLAFLEIFTIPCTDYSPLIGCTGLEDLNLGRTYGDPTPLTKMTWLKNVWWANVHGTRGLPCSNAKAVLEEALPNTNLRFDLAHPTASGWRKLDNYFGMRDFMGMFYLD